jgi:hypothetical protein
MRCPLLEVKQKVLFLIRNPPHLSPSSENLSQCSLRGISRMLPAKGSPRGPGGNGGLVLELLRRYRYRAAPASIRIQRESRERKKSQERVDIDIDVRKREMRTIYILSDENPAKPNQSASAIAGGTVPGAGPMKRAWQNSPCSQARSGRIAVTAAAPRASADSSIYADDGNQGLESTGKANLSGPSRSGSLRCRNSTSKLSLCFT